GAFDAEAINATIRRKARMEVFIHFPRAEYSDRFVQGAVEHQRHALSGYSVFRCEPEALASGMYSGVRPPGQNDRRGMLQYRCERAFDFTLNAWPVCLPLRSAILRAIVTANSRDKSAHRSGSIGNWSTPLPILRNQFLNRPASRRRG